MQAMILAAGLGTRLQPHTLIRPKPLFPILNYPLLLLTIKRLQRFGFDHIMVNCHHLREQMVDALEGIPEVTIQEEEIILGTGGGLRRSVKYLRDEPVLVTNGDIYHSIDLPALYRQHQEKEKLVTLAMHNNKRFNKVAIKDGRVASFDNETNLPKLAFTGLHVVQPEILEEITLDKYSCIIDHYRRMVQQGREIDCYMADDCFWTDMGTPDDYLALHHGLLRGTIPCWEEIGAVRKPYCIAPRAKLPAHVELSDWACIGEAHIENRCHLERVVIWDEVAVPSGSKVSDQIVSSDYIKN